MCIPRCIWLGDWSPWLQWVEGGERCRTFQKLGTFIHILKKLICCLIKPLNSSGLIFWAFWIFLYQIFMYLRELIWIFRPRMLWNVFMLIYCCYISLGKKKQRSLDRKICITRKSLVDTNDTIFYLQRKKNPNWRNDCILFLQLSFPPHYWNS